MTTLATTIEDIDDKQLPVKVDERARVERSLARLSKLADLMDDQFELPLVKYKIGLDPLIGLIPGGGDWVTWVVSTYIVFEGLRLRVPPSVLFGIGRNITLDLLVGYVPGVGDVLDVLIKANKRSVQLLLDHFEAKPDRSAPERIHVPERAMERPRGSSALAWATALLVVTASFVLACLPFVLIWYLASS